MTVRKIENPREFFKHVVDVDVEEFKENPTDLRAAYHASISLVSLRDWVVKSHRDKVWTFAGVKRGRFGTKEELQCQLKSTELGAKEQFVIVTDIANAAKHMFLCQNKGKKRLQKIADVNVPGLGEPSGRFSGVASGAPAGALPAGSGFARLLVKIDGELHDVKECVMAVHAVWQRLFIENSW